MAFTSQNRRDLDRKNGQSGWSWTIQGMRKPTPPAGPGQRPPSSHLVRLLHTEHGQIDATGLLYIVTEYAEEVLSEIIPERPLTPGEANDMLVPVLDPLFYLHGQGFVHGHLNPSKILVVDNQVKLSRDRLEITGELGETLSDAENLRRTRGGHRDDIPGGGRLVARHHLD